MDTLKYPKIDTLFKRDDNHKLTDELRRPVIGTIKTWRVTEKADGTNIRLFFDAQNRESMDELPQFGGRTDRAQLPSELVNNLQGLDYTAVWQEMDDHGVDELTIFGEGYGPKIQNGGDYADEQSFILFDVNVAGKWWLDDDAVSHYADILGLPRVPVMGDMSLDEIIELVRDGFDSLFSVRPRPAEGVVARPLEPLYDNRGSRLILKLKTKDFS